MYYKIKNGSITLGGNTILENIDFSVTDNEKIGIVGRNGTGKTTLLKGLIGELDFEDGYEKVIIEKTNDFKIGYVKQNSEINNQKTMLEYILEAYKNLTNIEKRLKSLEEKMLTSYTDKVLNDYNNLINSYQLNGGYEYKKEYELALKSFGFTKEDQEKQLNEFSGGQLTKLAFLKLLLEKPDLLILDEPTNHLDLPTIEWLEDYLKKYKKSLIVVSHDQMFLDNVCNVIYDLEFGNLKRYNGNYSDFLKQKQMDYEKQLKDYEMQQKEIKRLQAIADKFRYKPTKASMAMSKLKQIEKMKVIEKPQKENQKTFKISFDPELESYREVLKIKNLSIGYTQELCKIDLEVNRKDKIGIIGSNGSGKSTFLKTILGEIPKLGGKFVFGKNANIAYFSQQLENLDSNKTIYEEIESSFPSLSEKEIRTLLGTFEFTKEDVFKYIKDLSGGEKVRVSLCKLLYTKPNVLILDEPTNHLDIISKSTIERLLKDYQGTVIMVSHDRYLIKNVCTRLLVFKNKEVEIYNYGYQEYLEKRNISKEDKIVPKKNQVKESTSLTKNQYNINKEIQKVERKITTLEKKIDTLTNELYKKEVYSNQLKSSQIQKEINIVQEELDENIILWEELLNKVN